MTRRSLLLLPGAAVLLGQAPRGGDPQNLSFPLEAIEGGITPPDLFFVRDHFSEPGLSLDSWKLRIEGRVRRPLELSLADLLEAPTRKLEAVLECAGNVAGGSAVSNGVWEGVPIAHLLDEAGTDREAEGVLLEGADTGRLMQNSPRLPYCQLVTMAKCRQPESMVAFKLNDRFLPRRNGFPARAFFPGWYGMDAVKWLTRIVVLGPGGAPNNFQASGMEQVYNRVTAEPGGQRKIVRLSEIQVKSAIAWPADKMKLPAGRHLVRGFAWTGGGPVRRVEVSTEGGRTWTAAQLAGIPKPLSWVAWRYSWNASPGDHVLMSRATDGAGRTQPLTRDPARKDGYELNFCLPVRCEVR
ncbi:MAG TPA: molybdopterin-dependent oxidoreductase [Bryobacteraceae bacterium]|nr:molybdopterin-dependent oxidoreductase [Bryobacteraceae bacterium]